MSYRTTVFLLSQIRKFTTSKSLKARKSHYDSLGLKKNATQAEVKGAYYELSKVYHPDRHLERSLEEREKNSERFRDITEAYEVLGNVKSRRMYDKGFFDNLTHSSSAPTKEDPYHKFYKSRDTRNRPPPPNGRVPIYDFDEWSRQHYSATFHRTQEVKSRREFLKETSKTEKEASRDAMFGISAIFIVLCSYFYRQYISEYVYVTPQLENEKCIKEKNIS